MNDKSRMIKTSGSDISEICETLNSVALYRWLLSEFNQSEFSAHATLFDSTKLNWAVLKNLCSKSRIRNSKFIQK